MLFKWEEHKMKNLYTNKKLLLGMLYPYRSFSRTLLSIAMES